MDYKIDRATMTGVLNIGDIFELIDDGFDKARLRSRRLPAIGMS